jgi:hypothetical protein
LARCPICKTEQHGYSWTATPKGKKWLKNVEGNWHDCPNTTSKYQSKSSFVTTVKLVYKKETLEKHAQLSGFNLTEHTKVFHPNNEILDDIDFMVISDESKESIRVDWNMPKTNKKYIVKNKFVSRVE